MWGYHNFRIFCKSVSGGNSQGILRVFSRFSQSFTPTKEKTEFSTMYGKIHAADRHAKGR